MKEEQEQREEEEREERMRRLKENYSSSVWRASLSK